MKIILIFFLLYFTQLTKGQNIISYRYDDSGNRTERVITLSTNQSDTVNQTKSGKKEIYQQTISEYKILIYPNPTKGQIKVDIQGNKNGSPIELYLYSLKGELLISKSPASDSNTLDLSPYPIGSYILKIILKNKMSQWKIVKE